MKNIFRKLGVFVIALVLLFTAFACRPDDGKKPDGGDDDPDPKPPVSQFVDPNTVFTKYDNKSYNEYLLGDDVTIANQWDGYGIGDPFVMRYNGKYYLYCSSLDSEIGVRGYVSADLVNWVPMTGTGLRTGYVSEDSCTAAAYAPEVYYFNGTFYMYTSPGGRGHYILTSSAPEGPFVRATNNFQMSIDGSVLIDDDESMWFTYAGNGGITMAKMDSMLSVNASSTPQLNDTSIGGWTEGSYILKRDGIYYITYTGNHVASDGYRIAYATADHVAAANGNPDRNAFSSAVNNPLALNTESSLKGIGHSSTVLGPDMDSHYLVYHYLNSSGGPNRSLGIDRLLFNGKFMSVAPMLEDSVTPALPEFYANGKDETKFDISGDLVLSKESAAADFTAEWNVTGASTVKVVFGYESATAYNDVTVDFTAKTVKLNKTVSGTTTEVAEGTLKNDFDANVLHTIRVAAKDGVVDVVFDNMVKIDNAELAVKAGKIGYADLGEATVGYTAISNVAMGMSDRREAKQSSAYIGANQYLYNDVYTIGSKLSSKSELVEIEEYPFEGVNELKLGATGDYASYLVNFAAEGHYGIELVYKKADAGKKIGIKLGDGYVYRCTLPTVVADDDEYVKAIVGEFDAAKGITTLRMENVGSEVSFVCFKFVVSSNVTPQYEQSLADYAERGADYKTIWKIKDEGHYAKAGTRQLVYFGNNTITDFTLEVEIKLEGASGVSTAGIVFHASSYAASSHDSYMSLQGYYFSVSNNYARLERLNYADGTNTMVTEVTKNPFTSSNEFIKVKIQVRGNHIVVSSGDQTIIDAYDAWAFTNGKVGLYTNGAAVIFRNLKISA